MTAPLVVTMGEPAGIGAEITLFARNAGGVPPFALIDDAARVRALADRLGIPVPVVKIATLAETPAAFANGLPVLHRPLEAPVSLGHPSARHAAQVVAAIDEALALTLSGEACALVTNPIQKSTLYEAGFKAPGHTEYLAERIALRTGHSSLPVMMLVCPELRVVPVTVHLSLAEALAALSTERIVLAGRATARALIADFGIDIPRLAVAALNPHAGEAGALGLEEIEIIAPACTILRNEGIAVEGPLPADTLFHDKARARFGAALCMYHDQALIPLKTIDFARGVNVTLGLPVVRTSPDHGTALDIAGSGKADPASLIAALTLAAAIAATRRAHAA